jgi:hypothetical protein
MVTAGGEQTLELEGDLAVSAGDHYAHVVRH